MSYESTEYHNFSQLQRNAIILARFFTGDHVQRSI